MDKCKNKYHCIDKFILQIYFRPMAIMMSWILSIPGNLHIIKAIVIIRWIFWQWLRLGNFFLNRYRQRDQPYGKYIYNTFELIKKLEVFIGNRNI